MTSRCNGDITIPPIVLSSTVGLILPNEGIQDMSLYQERQVTSATEWQDVHQEAVLEKIVEG